MSCRLVLQPTYLPDRMAMADIIGKNSAHTALFTEVFSIILVFLCRTPFLVAAYVTMTRGGNNVLCRNGISSQASEASKSRKAEFPFTKAKSLYMEHF